MVFPTCTFLNAKNAICPIPRKASCQAKPSRWSKLVLGIWTSSVTRPAKSKDAISCRDPALTMTAMQKQCANQSDELHTKSVLIVEDDKRLMRCLTLAMEARGFEVMNAEIGVQCDSSNKSACPRVRSRRPKIGRRMRIRRYLGAQGTTIRRTRHHPDRLRKYRHRSQGSQTRCRGLSHQTCGHGRYYFDPARAERSEN